MGNPAVTAILRCNTGGESEVRERSRKEMVDAWAGGNGGARRGGRKKIKREPAR